MKIFNAISLSLALCTQAYIAMVWIGLKSMEIRVLLMHARSGGKDTSSMLSGVMECCKGRLVWNWTVFLVLGVAHREREEDSSCLHKQANGKQMAVKAANTYEKRSCFQQIRPGSTSGKRWGITHPSTWQLPITCGTLSLHFLAVLLSYHSQGPMAIWGRWRGKERKTSFVCVCVCVSRVKTKMNVLCLPPFPEPVGPSEASCRAVSWKVHPHCNWLCQSCQGDHLAAPHAFVPQLPFEIHQLQ